MYVLKIKSSISESAYGLDSSIFQLLIAPNEKYK
jgi:hypothetical protein